MERKNCKLNVKLSKLSAFFLLLFFVAVTAGCARHVYEGPKRPKTEIAWLIGGPKGTHKIWFHEVDGKKIGGSSRIALLPGRHKIKMGIEIDKFFFYGGSTEYRTWDFEAGHKYKVVVDIEPGISNEARFTVTIQDVTK